VWDGHGICFCERCLGRWEQYRATHHSELEALSPTEFEADLDDCPAHHAAWTRFKCSLVTEMFAGWRQMLRERAAARGACPSGVWLDSWLSVSTEQDGMYFNLHDPWRLPERLNHLMPTLYDRAAAVRRRPAPLVKAAGAENVLVGLTLGEPANGRQIFPPEEGRAQVLEAAFAPTMGYVLWTYPRSDAGTLAAVAEANDALAHVEDVLLDGSSCDRLYVVEGSAEVTAYQRNGEIAALVRDCEHPAQVRLRLAGDGDWLVTEPGGAPEARRIDGERRELTLELATRNLRVLCFERR